MSLFAAQDLILVTGASSGIGRACALECVARGATVLASGRDQQKLAAARAASAAPHRWHSVPFDLTAGLKDIPGWITALRKEHGRLYGLLHAAGAARIDSIAGLDIEDARAHFDLNFFVPLMLAKSFSDRRNCRSNSSMVFIASISSVHPEKGQVLYGSAKAALIAAVKAISQELAPRGQRANSISPATVETPLLEELVQSRGEAYLARERERYPMGFGKPMDVAHLACFLLSPKASWITGQNFLMDGGAY